LSPSVRSFTICFFLSIQEHLACKFAQIPSLMDHYPSSSRRTVSDYCVLSRVFFFFFTFAIRSLLALSKRKRFLISSEFRYNFKVKLEPQWQLETLFIFYSRSLLMDDARTYFEPMLYTRSQGWKNLGPTLSIFGFLFGPKLLLNARTLMWRY
jgi:hypothetical protein